MGILAGSSSDGDIGALVSSPNVACSMDLGMMSLTLPIHTCQRSQRSFIQGCGYFSGEVHHTNDAGKIIESFKALPGLLATVALPGGICYYTSKALHRYAK